MPNDETPTATVKDSESITTEVHHIAEDYDFQPYLQAVITASQRTRSLVYVLLIALIAIFAAYRNTAEPDWIDARLRQLQLAYDCLQRKDSTGECKAALDYAKGFMYTNPNKMPVSSESQMYDDPSIYQPKPTVPPDQIEMMKELQHQIEVLITQRTESLEVRIPLLGLQMDMNDLGLISGITLFFLMYIFLLLLTREEENINQATDKAVQSKNKDNLRLLLMVQVFSSPSKSKTGVTSAVYLAFALPFLLHLRILFTDIADPDSRATGIYLIGYPSFYAQMITEILCLFGILWVSIRSGQQWRHIDNALNRIHKAYDESVEASVEGSAEQPSKPAQIPASNSVPEEIAAQSSELHQSNSGIGSKPAKQAKNHHSKHNRR